MVTTYHFNILIIAIFIMVNPVRYGHAELFGETEGYSPAQGDFWYSEVHPLAVFSHYLNEN